MKGYTIPLDKRLAADGRGLQGVHINENFAKFAEALYIADRKVSLLVHVFCIRPVVSQYTNSRLEWSLCPQSQIVF